MLVKTTTHTNRAKQYGFSLILFIFLIGLITAGLIVKSLPSGSFSMQSAVNTNKALSDAKLALIGYVVAGFSGAGTNPGQFPCSENVTSIGTISEGQANGSCSNTTVTVGRLAWRTVGTGDLKDNNTDRLWYALSAGFRSPSITTPINSDTLAGLSLDGVQNQAIAILFSPGNILAGQSRPTPTSTSGPNVINYLDDENNNGDNKFISGPISPAFNDRLVTIKPDDIYPILEKRVLNEIKNYLVTYKAAWGAYPFPALFNPSTASYVGSSTTSGGFLPVMDAGVTWSSSSTWKSIRQSNGVISSGSCVTSALNSVLTCTITGQNYTGARSITVTGYLNNVGLSFYKQMDITNSSDLTFSPATIKTTSALSYSLNSTGGGAVTLTGSPTSNTTSYIITFNRPPQFDDWNTTATIANYIYQNNWHQLIYYKVSPDFLPGGSGSCGACLTVNKFNSSPVISQTGIHALLMSAGRKLTTTVTQNRPGSSMTDYFDSANNQSGGVIFDTKNSPTNIFNDQVEIVE